MNRNPAHRPRGGSSKKVANNLVALSSTAVLAIYAAGYLRTKSAADEFAGQANQRRMAAPVVAPAPVEPATPIPPAEIEPVGPLAISKSAAASQDVPATPARKASPTTVASQPKTQAARLETPAAPAAVASISPTPAPVAEAAPPSVEAPAAAVAAPAEPAPAQTTEASTSPAPLEGPYNDGTYVGTGYCSHGRIVATVVVEGGRVVSSVISQCRTRYPCDMIEKLPPQVVERQNAEVDWVTGATESANAFYYAVTDALKQAK